MLSKTLTEGLEQYAIGPKLHKLRLKKGLGLVQLGEHTGLSPAMISKIERGQLFPTLPTLLRIAMVFGVGLEHFFVENSEKKTVSIVRAKERLRLPDNPKTKPPAYFFENLVFPVNDRKLEGYRAVFPSKGEASEPHTHEGAEIVYIVSGKLAITIEGEKHILSTGDAIYFDPSVPHSYCCDGRTDTEAVVVVTA